MQVGVEHREARIGRELMKLGRKTEGKVQVCQISDLDGLINCVHACE